MVAAVGLRRGALAGRGASGTRASGDNVVLGGGPVATPTGGREQLEPRRRTGSARRSAEDDLLYPFSAVFLAGLPATGEAVTLPYSQTTLLESAVGAARGAGRRASSWRSRPARRPWSTLEQLEAALGDGL